MSKSRDDKSKENKKELEQSSIKKFLHPAFTKKHIRSGGVYLLTPDEINGGKKAFLENKSLKKIRRYFDKQGNQRANLTELEKRLKLPFSMVLTNEGKVFILTDIQLGSPGEWGRVKIILDVGEPGDLRANYNSASLDAIKILNVNQQIVHRLADHEANMLKKLGRLKGTLSRKTEKRNVRYLLQDLAFGEVFSKCKANIIKNGYQEILVFTISLLSSLNEFHKRGIVHNDLHNPTNIIYDEQNKKVTIIDVGNSQQISEIPILLTENFNIRGVKKDTSAIISTLADLGYPLSEKYEYNAIVKKLNDGLLTLDDAIKELVKIQTSFKMETLSEQRDTKSNHELKRDDENSSMISINLQCACIDIMNYVQKYTDLHPLNVLRSILKTWAENPENGRRSLELKLGNKLEALMGKDAESLITSAEILDTIFCNQENAKLAKPIIDSLLEATTTQPKSKT